MFCRSSSLWRCAGTLVLAASIFAALPQQGRGQSPLPTEFAKQPPESLLGRLTSSLPQPHQSSRLAASGFLLLESQKNPKAPATLGDWSFQLFRDRDEARYQRLEHRSGLWHGSTYWSGPDWTRVGKDWQHTGINTPSVRCFRAPRDGRVHVTGRVYKADTNNGGGDGVRLEIRHRAKTIWKGEIDGDDEKGLAPELTFDVRKNDAIRFVVHKRGAISYDTTHWDPLVAYADGKRHQASDGFSKTKQGDAHWFYEMETSPLAENRLPTVRWFDRNAMLREETVAVDRELNVTGERALGLFALDDGTGTTGVALALIPTETNTNDSQQWQLHCTLTEGGRLRVQVVTTDKQATAPPKLAIAPYAGSWSNGFSALQTLASDKDAATLRTQIAGIVPRGPETTTPSIGLDLWALVQEDWRQQDDLAPTVDSHRAALSHHVAQTRKLLDDFGQGERFAADARRLEALARAADRAESTLAELSDLYLQTRWLKRRVALANPLMQFGPMLFCKRAPTSYSHQVMQYYGWRARPGGGLFVLENPGYSLQARDILDGQLAGGNIVEPRLSYDGKRIVFSFVENAGRKYVPAELDNKVDEGFYHIYEVNVDGTNLRQLTSGPYEDITPTYLPDGGIAFCSSRRLGHSRCFGAQFSSRWQIYTLHRMDADGDNLTTLSYHDTNEWFPAVSNEGLIVYSRWDYIDRDAVTHQNLWATRPDGTNPIAVWGNATAKPHCTFQIQPIPNCQKFVCTASAHHSVTAGSIIVIDPTKGDNGQQAITRITPEVPFPEAESRNIPEYYAAPWPLSETYFLAAYSPKPLVWEPGANDVDALGVYLIDAFGNRELVYRDPAIGSTNPTPLVSRQAPPALRTQLADATEPTGEMLLLDVYAGLGDVPRDTIKSLRVVQIFPKTTPVANHPAIGLAGEENARAILGTVPVEADGSARFLVPAKKPVLFQALDADGFAYQTMRTLTYLQPGERTTCIGCHDSQTKTPYRKAAKALLQPPAKIDPGELGGRPFSFVEVVQPVLDKHCVQCHSGEKIEGKVDLSNTPHDRFSKAYWSLCGDRNFWGAGTNLKNAREALVPRFGARNQIQTTAPGGHYGALGSRLIRLLRKGHYDAKLSDKDYRRLAAWIDCNATFYGVYSADDQARQLRGEMLEMPEIQ